MNIKKIQKKALMLLVTITFAASTFGYYTTPIFAASTTAHVRIVGASRTIWYGDVPTTGCTITDTANTQHTYTQSVAVCAVVAAAQAGVCICNETVGIVWVGVGDNVIVICVGVTVETGLKPVSTRFEGVGVGDTEPIRSELTVE